MMLNLPCKRSKWGGSDRKQGIHKAVLYCVHLMSIARAASLGSSKFSLGFDYFLIVSAFFLQSFNLNFEVSLKNANNESRIIWYFCESYKSYSFLLSSLHSHEIPFFLSTVRAIYH